MDFTKRLLLHGLAYAPSSGILLWLPFLLDSCQPLLIVLERSLVESRLGANVVPDRRFAVEKWRLVLDHILIIIHGIPRQKQFVFVTQ